MGPSKLGLHGGFQQWWKCDLYHSCWMVDGFLCKYIVVELEKWFQCGRHLPSSLLSILGTAWLEGESHSRKLKGKWCLYTRHGTYVCEHTNNTKCKKIINRRLDDTGQTAGVQDVSGRGKKEIVSLLESSRGVCVLPTPPFHDPDLQSVR